MMMGMKIVVNARFLTQKVTGVQRFAIEISLHLKRLLEDNIVFVAPNNIIDNGICRNLNPITIGTHKGHIWEQIDLPRFLCKMDSPKLLCLCNTGPLSYNNKIVTVHDVAFEAYPATFSKGFLWTYKFLIPRIVKSSKKIITVSEFSKKEIIKYYGINSDKIEVVYNAVDSRFQPIYNENLKRQRYILAVSSLNYRKNFISVLKAFEIFNHKNAAINLYIIGDIESRNFKGIDISKYLNNPRIKFLGRVSDNELIQYYSNAEAFLYPSIYEGFGIPPLEAQSCGCPVLVSDIPPLHEVVSESGEYCNPFSPQNIADNMEKILNIKNNGDLRSKGFNNVKRFSWLESAKNISQIIL